MGAGDVLHALPETFGFTYFPDGIDSTAEFGIGTAHTDDLEFPTNDIERMGEEQRGSACNTSTSELSKY